MCSSQMILIFLISGGIWTINAIQDRLIDCPQDEHYTQLGGCKCLPDIKDNIIGVGCIANDMTSLPTHIPPYTHIFYYENNTLEALESIPATYHHLEYMYMQHNGLRSITGSVFGLEGKHDGLQHVLELDLAYNKLTRLFADTLTGLTSLQNLTLAHNELYDLESPFAELKNLQNLDLRHNKLRRLSPNVFRGLPNLTSVALENNNFGAIPYQAIATLDNVERLHLQYCNIRNLDDNGFLILKELRVLTLQGNVIELINNNSFNGLFQLEALDISHNRIRAISSGAFQYFYDTIQSVNLEGNLIVGLSPDLLPWGSVRVTMAGNPLVCDCDLAWGPLITSRTGENIVCTAPETVANRTVSSLLPEEFVCEHSLNPQPVSAGISGVSLILAVVIPCVIILIIVIVGIVCIVKRKNAKKNERKSVKYSAVYKPTTEQQKPVPKSTEL